jgi:putative transposase
MLGSHSDALLLVHAVWSTLDRRPTLEPRDDEWLADFTRTRVRALGCDALAVGNAEDHVHLLVRCLPTLALAELMQAIKGASSHAWNRRLPGRQLRWQTGYWSRSVDQDALGTLIAYILNQRRHHGEGATRPAWEQHAPAPVDPVAT